MKKEELMQYKNLKIEINKLEERIEALEEQKTSIKSPTITDMPNGGKGLELLDLMVMIEETQTRLTEKRKELLKMLNKIEDVIETLDNSLDRNILRARYIECKKWEQICVELHYSWRQIHKLHSDVLKKIA